MSRKSPVRHTVKQYTRRGRLIKSHKRGKGTSTSMSNRRVVGRGQGINHRKLVGHPEPYRECYERAHVRNRYLYHATPTRNLMKIRKVGLGAPAYFATNPQIALDIVNVLRPEVGGGKLIVLKVDISDYPLYKDLYWEVIRPYPEHHEIPLKKMTQGKMFYSLGDIPTEKIREVVGKMER